MILTNTYKLFILLITFSIFAISCNDDDNMIATEPQAYENGLFVLHEGNFGAGNGSVSFISEDLSIVEHDIFQTINNRLLGDVPQSMYLEDSLAFIVVNNSQKVEIVDRYNFESRGTINTGLLNPRYVTIANNKGYISNWGDGTVTTDDYISVFNLSDFVIEATIPVGEGPEKMIEEDGKIYVANQGGFGYNNIITVINTDNSTETITVGDVPNSMEIVDNNLFVLCGGKPSFTGDETGGKLIQISLSTNAVVNTFNFEPTEHPSLLSEENDQLYYYLNGEVYAMSTNATALPTTSILSGVNAYNMVVDHNSIFTVDAKDFASEGQFTIYDLTGNTIFTEQVDIIPNGIYFNN